MRLWTIHPRYLDAQGLVAAWREGLLAQNVLRGETRGYTRHPQLARFQAEPQPVEVIAAYLAVLAKEAGRRGYSFDLAKISEPRFVGKLVETRGQLLFEWRHLKRKLRARAPQLYRECRSLACPKAHPLFRIVEGPVRDWEKRAGARRPA
ncbi:MAG: hypothetical protein QOD12_3123 [Verrucomicrobiota bacterium]